jgi:hypothetical protein
MKKSELTQLTQIIEQLVAKEIRKQLPAVIAETFQNMMGKKKIVTEQIQPILEPESEPEPAQPDFKTSLRELFAGTPVIRNPQSQPQTKQTKQFTSNPKLNQVLNETVSDLRDRERLVGGAAFMGGYSPTLNIVPGFNPTSPMMETQEPEPEFLKNMPVMQGASVSMPVSHPPVISENHVPLSTLPPGVSALDVKNSVVDPVVRNALTKNYSQMMKIIDKKRGNI